MENSRKNEFNDPEYRRLLISAMMTNHADDYQACATCGKPSMRIQICQHGCPEITTENKTT